MIIDRNVCNDCILSVCLPFSYSDLSFYFLKFKSHQDPINPDFGPQLEISISVNSLFMVKDSYQCMNYFYDFGPQQEISYEFRTPTGNLL